MQYRQPFGVDAAVARIPNNLIISDAVDEVLILRRRDFLKTQYVGARRVDIFKQSVFAVFPRSADLKGGFEADIEGPDGVFALRLVREQFAVVCGQRSVIAAGGKQRQHRQSRDDRDDNKDGFFHNFSSAFIIQWAAEFFKM